MKPIQNININSEGVDDRNINISIWNEAFLYKPDLRKPANNSQESEDIFKN